MTITIQPPQPGDLITSNWMKQLIDQLIALDRRIADLEAVVPGADGKIRILQITPSDAVIGDQLQIIGLNFGLPTDNIVSFDGGNSQVPTGNDQRLFVTVPPVNLGNAASKMVTVGVTNNTRGFDSWPITVRNIVPMIPGGRLTVTPGPIPSITPGNDAVIPFTIEARTNMDESYDLVPVLPTVPQGEIAWTATMVTAQGAVELPRPYRISIPKPEPGQVASIVTAFLKVTVPTGTTVTNPFIRLDVNSVHNPPPGSTALTGTSGEVTFQFGQPQQSQTVGFSIDSLVGINGDKTMLTVPISLTPPTPPINGATYLFQGLKKAKYTATLTWKDTTNSNRGWTASFGGAPGIGDWPRTTMTIDMTTTGDFGPQKVAIVGGQGATQNTLLITVRSNAEPTTDFGFLNQGVKPKTG